MRSRRAHYALALVLVACSCLWFFWAAHILAAPYLASFMVAVALSSLFGIGPGCVALVAATLASDFFFIPPIFDLSFNRYTWLAAGNYALALLCARAGAQFVNRKIGRSLLFEKFVIGGNGAKLVGRLDGESCGEIYGWAVNTDSPLRPPNITIYVNDRPVGEVLPVWYRPDVGQHSFYFDLPQVCAPCTAARVDARFATARALANCPLRVRIPPARKPSHSETVLFMHIAKSAGTAFREAIVGNYKQSEIAYIYPDAPGFLIPNLGVLPLEQRAKFRLVIGHFQFGVHTFFPQECLYVSIVRDPVQRVLSQFHYLLPELGAGPDADLPRLLVEIMERRPIVNLDNLLVRCFAGAQATEVPPGRVDSAVYERALQNLRTNFKFVGYQEYAKDAYLTLQTQLGWHANESLKLANRGHCTDYSGFESVRHMIEHFNSWDCLIYQEIKRLFPLPAV